LDAILEMGRVDIRVIPRVMREVAMRIMHSARGLRWGIRAPDMNARIGPGRVRGRRYIPAFEGEEALVAWER
jgi:hypothetical protein